MKKYNDMIDVIIPAYNVADNILSRCLASIACQDIINDVEVTIVDDASTTQNYAAVIKHFAPMMKINLLRYEVNGGPGVARQYGIDNTNLPYFTCIDADDTFAGAFAIEMLYKNLIQDPNAACCIGSFLEEHENLQFVPHVQDLIWMFGKLYRRSFIKKL